ncbi:transketolase [Fontivita pretiosa]|uniref:transketolase n=1 Tax=Fontivita pretiosa TaxID=2989684 RepID=UPI003D184CD3
MSFAAAVHRKAIELAKLSVEMTTAAGSGHPSSALSLAHLVTVLMYHQMRWDPRDPWNRASDRLVLSEGHAVPIIYAAMADLGVMIGKSRDEARPMTRDDAMKLRAIDSPIDGHPNPGLGVPFFDAATGSLGQGLSVAAGLAAAAKMDGVDRDIYCLIGDGEAREGQIWEAMDFIVDHALVNCVPIFNCNELAQSDWVSPQQSFQSIRDKAQAYGFIVRVIDGHDPDQISRALNELHVVKNGHRPLAIVARTIKGWGSPAEQGMGKHGTPVSADKLKTVLAELDQTARELGVADSTPATSHLSIPAPRATASAMNHDTRITIAPFLEGLAAVGLDKLARENKPIATRKAYGAALLALGRADSRVIGLDGDVKNSTYAEWLAQHLPEQYLECRIAEQNMISVAVGLAAAGKIPFVSTFAKFVMRGYDQIEMAIITGANIKVVGSHAGVTPAADGPSQMGLPDVAFFRSFTRVQNYAGQTAVRYFFPSDAVSCYRIVELMANLNGCCYLRTLRADLKLLYSPDERFEVGGYKVLREGGAGVFVASGYMVHECLDAARELSQNGQDFTVIDAYSLPLNTQQILEMAQRNGGQIITVEDNYSGGLDVELASAIATSGADVRLRSHYVTRLPKSGRQPQHVLAYLNLDAGSLP